MEIDGSKSRDCDDDLLMLVEIHGSKSRDCDDDRLVGASHSRELISNLVDFIILSLVYGCLKDFVF